MANEITATSSLQLAKGNDTFKTDGGSPSTERWDQTGTGRFNRVVTVPAADTAITLDDITTPGWARFRNLDATNYVEWGPNSGGSIVPIGRMEPGEAAGPFRITQGTFTLRMQANTSPCDVAVDVLED